MQEKQHTVKPEAVEVVAVPFEGAAIEAVHDPETGDVWASIRRVCETLGVDRKSQQAKLAEKAWARTGVFNAPVAGKRRDQTFIHLDSLPMWLATIDPSRVSEDARPVLEAYQHKAAQALRDHFLRPKPEVNLYAQLTADPDAALRLVEAIGVHARRAKQLEAVVAEQAPKAEAWERVEKAEDEYLIREATKLLRPSTGVTERALVGALIANGWAQRLKKRLQATEKGMRRGVVVSRIHTWRDPVTGDQRSTPQLFVSGKGLRVLGEMFDLTRDDVLPRPERRH